MIAVILGGTKGIGESAAQCLRAQGWEVVTVARSGGDIRADLGTAEGRQTVLREVRARCPDGIDGLITNAGVAGAPDKPVSYVLRVNYFGTNAVTQGLFDLLEKRHGTVAVTVSATIGYTPRSKYFVDQLLTDCGDEERICAFMDSVSPDNAAQTVYVSTKFALARWVRRISASWAARGVVINAVAPGGVDTTIIPDMKTNPLFETVTMAQPMPTVYFQRDLMQPMDVGATLAFMVTPAARGNVGAVIYCDAGSSAIVNTERV